MPDLVPFPTVEPASRTYQSQRLSLHYWDWGNPGAPPLIMLHGGRDHGRSWDWLAGRLRDRWHIIAPDLRGHGDSAWAPGAAYGVPFYTNDLDRLIEAAGLVRPVLVSHSLGGNIALRYTGIYPERIRAVIAIEGLGPPRLAKRDETPPDERLAKWMSQTREVAGWQVKRYASLEDAEVRMREAHPRYSPALAAHLTRHGMVRNEDGTYCWKYDHYVRASPPTDIPQKEVRQLWARITCPVLLVSGGESWHTHPAEGGRDACFRTAEIVHFEQANHWVHHDQPEAFLALAERFLGGLKAEPA